MGLVVVLKVWEFRPQQSRQENAPILTCWNEGKPKCILNFALLCDLVIRLFNQDATGSAHSGAHRRARKDSQLSTPSAGSRRSVSYSRSKDVTLRSSPGFFLKWRARSPQAFRNPSAVGAEGGTLARRRAAGVARRRPFCLPRPPARPVLNCSLGKSQISLGGAEDAHRNWRQGTRERRKPSFV